MDELNPNIVSNNTPKRVKQTISNDRETAFLLQMICVAMRLGKVASLIEHFRIEKTMNNMTSDVDS